MSSYRMKYKIGQTQYHIPVQEDISGFGSGIPLGTILPYSANSQNPPEGFLFCDGSAISRSMFPDLFALIGTLYGEGDGLTTFNLPDFTGKFPEGALTAGTSKAAGLPNIEGEVATRSNTGVIADGAASPTGAFQLGSSYAKSPENCAGGSWALSFDASLSNSIYGNSTTVQLASITVRYIIKAFSATTSNSELIDITQYASALNQKPSKSLNDLSQAGEDHFYENDFCYVYPNNGTAQNPANITVNTKYVDDNPFSGYLVRAQIEVLVDGDWVEVTDGGATSSNPAGAYSSQLNDTIVTVVFRTFLVDNNPYITGMAKVATNNLTTAPARIKVWKIGKIPQSS